MPGGHSGSSHSSHSSSSHSSFSSSSRSSFSSSSRSSHSTTSHSSTVTRLRTNRNTTTTPNVFENTQRGRRNQPQGYRYYDNRPPRVIRTYNHVYWYYPMGWNNGSTYYNRGFYDEDGVYYDNILAECPNCGTTVSLSLDQASDYFYCPNCGEQMDIVTSGTGVKRSAAQSSGASSFVKVLAGGFIALMLMVSGFNLIRLIARHSHKNQQSVTETVVIDDWGTADIETDNTAIFGEQLYLSRNGNGSYTITNRDSYDVIAKWVADDEAYYDAETDMWFWYNNYVEPGVWQYWYDDISYNFGDYGWMEYEDGIWWIEKDYGDWIQVPSSYDTNVLWHIDY